MNKLLFINPYRHNLVSISRKVCEQIEALRSEYQVEEYSVVPGTRWFFARAIGRLAREIISPTIILRKDCVYYRYCPSSVVLNIILSLLSEKRQIWVEVNSAYKYELVNHRLQLWCHEISMWAFRGTPIVMLPVTGEIGRLDRVSEQARVLSNGFQLPSIRENVRKEIVEPVRFEVERQRSRGKRIAVFAGSRVEYWHGFDRIVELLRSIGDCYLVILGEFRYDQDMLLLREVEAGGEGRSFGLVTPEEARAIYNFSDFGLGSFGLDRLNMREGSPLKVREYLACGLPTLIGYDDVLLEDDWGISCLFKVDFGDVGAVREWLETVPSREVITEYAARRLSWQHVFESVGILNPSEISIAQQY